MDRKLVLGLIILCIFSVSAVSAAEIGNNDTSDSAEVQTVAIDFVSELSDSDEEVPDEPDLVFNDTIYNNITLGKEINYKDFLKISNLTLVSEMVEEKKIDYNYLLEENGFNLSGGERQRIILARALLKESDIYIFDESLNAIDIEKEKTILKNIFKLLKKKTIIVISHRFNNNDLFDKKIEILKGNLVYENT